LFLRPRLNIAKPEEALLQL